MTYYLYLIGMTKNYVIFLRCETDCNFDQDTCSNEPCILINMVPISHIEIKRYSKRKLEVLFPSGNVCYFKILMCRGCGKAWSQWRTLDQMCDSDLLPLVPELKLIYFSDLDAEIQKIMKDQKFLKHFSTSKKPLKYLASVLSDISIRRKKKPTEPTDDSVPEWNASWPNVEIFSETEKGDKKLETEKDRSNSISEGFKEAAPVFKHGKNLKKVRKTRLVKRFGEGIPEGCVFGLTLSYSELINGDKSTAHKFLKGKDCATPVCDSYIEKEATMTKQNNSIGSEPCQGETEKKPKRNDISKKRKKCSRLLKKILSATHFFTNISLLTVPDGLRKSKSVDSIYKISAKNYKTYVTSHNSLPDISETDFYRRCNRLSYSMNYFNDKVPYSHDQHAPNFISFRLPNENKTNSPIYCTSPICPKILVQKAKVHFIR